MVSDYTKREDSQRVLFEFSIFCRRCERLSVYPGYPVVKTSGNEIKVIVPDYRMNHQTNFQYDGVTAFMKVNTSDENLPLLGVYAVYSVSSGNLSLPYKVKKL